MRDDHYAWPADSAVVAVRDPVGARLCMPSELLAAGATALHQLAYCAAHKVLQEPVSQVRCTSTPLTGQRWVAL